MATRKARNKVQKKLDLLVPVDIYKLGTDEDPCFGKHYDPTQNECRRCGDCEACAIKLGQNNHIARAKVESKGNFMDMEEKEIYELTPGQKARKLIRRLVKTNPGITKSNLGKQVMAGLGISDSKFNNYLTKLITKGVIKSDKDKLTLK